MREGPSGKLDIKVLEMDLPARLRRRLLMHREHCSAIINMLENGITEVGVDIHILSDGMYETYRQSL